MPRALHLAVCLLIAAVLLASGGPAIAQTYPVKPIRMVVPYAPGGPSDVLARIYSQKLAEALGQPIIIDNKPGASGQIGAQDAARAAPDGYTLMVNASSVVILPHVMTSVLFDIEREFTPVHVMGSVPAILIVPATTPQNTVAELVAAFRNKGGKINYGVSGAGGAMHLIAENFRQLNGLDMQAIVYKGGGPAITAVMSGEVPMSFESLPAAMPMIKGGQLKVLAVSAPKRNPALPDAPTMIEQGYADFDLGSWYGIWAPAKTPREIVKQLNAEFVRIAGLPDIKAKFESLGTDPETLSLEALAAFQNKEFERWGAIAKKAGIKLE